MLEAMRRGLGEHVGWGSAHGIGRVGDVVGRCGLFGTMLVACSLDPGVLGVIGDPKADAGVEQTSDSATTASWGTTMGDWPGAASGSTAGGAADSGDGSDQQPTCNPRSSPALRLLTPRQYANTVFDLFGVVYEPELVVRETPGGFDRVEVDPVTDERFSVAAEAVAGLVDPDHETMCLAGTAACIEHLAYRAWRRPVADAELADLLAVHAAAGGGSEQRARAVIAETLRNRDFYGIHLAESPTRFDADGMLYVALNGYALASRLSYFLWNTTPPPALLELARTGALESPETLRTTAAHMFAAPPAREAIALMYQQWLKVDDYARDEEHEHSALAESMRSEVAGFVETVVFTGDGRLRTLLTDSRTYLDAELASLYGDDVLVLPSQLPGEAALDPARRRGILTLTSVLAANSGASDRVTWTGRGLLLRERWSGSAFPAAPADSHPGMPVAVTGETRYEHHARVVSDPACSCHDWIDPLTFAFDHYDALGRWTQTVPGPNPSGVASLARTEGIWADDQQTFGGALELVEQLLERPELYGTVARQHLELALRSADLEACAWEPSTTKFVASDGDLRLLVIDTVMTTAFRTVRGP